MQRLLAKSFFDGNLAQPSDEVELRVERMSAAKQFPRPELNEVVGETVLLWKSKENVFWGSGRILAAFAVENDAPKGPNATSTYTTWRITVAVEKLSSKALSFSEVVLASGDLPVARRLAESLKQPFDKIIYISKEEGKCLDLLLLSSD